MMAWLGAFVGLSMIGWGLLVVCGQASPGPGWAGRDRDVVTGTPTPAAARAGAANVALGGGVLASWWLGFAPGLYEGWASLASVLCLVAALVLYGQEAAAPTSSPA